MESQMKQLQKQIADIQAALREKDAQILELKTESKALRERVEKLESLQPVQSATANKAKLEDVQGMQSLTLNQVSAFRDSGIWDSPEFYSHRKGYKMRLHAIVSSSAGPMSVSVYSRSGEYDDFLKWPMRAQVTLQLVDVAHGHPLYEKVLTGGQKLQGPGPLCDMSQLDADLDDYIHEDTLHFRVKVVAGP